ncbi:hypothetical protein BV881_33765 [Streptomyces sp. ZL-24]|nr:hypothetical protein BV881_33765 [Streptomyces sp. ZL-24]
MDLGGEHPPGVHAVAGEDAGGELLADLRSPQGAGGGGLGDQEDVHAQLEAHVEDLVEGVDGRGDLRVAGLAGLLPVAGQLLHRRVDLFEEDQQAGPDVLGVGADTEFVGDPRAAPAFDAEGDELVVDVGDVGAVGDAGQAARPEVGDPLGVQNEDPAAVVEHLARDAPQDHRLTATRGGVDQDVRGVGVQVDGDDPPSGPEPDDRCGLLRLGDQLPRLRVLEEGQGRRLAGLLHQHVRLAALRVPGERHALEGELLRDEVGHHVAGEPEPGGQVDTYLGVVVAEVLRDVEVAARVGLLRQPERLMQGLVQRAHPLAHQLPPLTGQDHVRRGAHREDGSRADSGGLQRRERRLPVLPQLRQGLAGGVQVPGRQIAALRDTAPESKTEGQPAPPGLVGAAAGPCPPPSAAPGCPHARTWRRCGGPRPGPGRPAPGRPRAQGNRRTHPPACRTSTVPWPCPFGLRPGTSHPEADTDRKSVGLCISSGDSRP